MRRTTAPLAPSTTALATTALATTALATTALLGLALLSPATAAAAETCRGEAATIVGSAGARIVGTEGGDVVVTNGSTRVATLGGDDLVCVTEPSDPSGVPVAIDTGAGDDVLDSTGADTSIVSAVLGQGADRYEGGDGSNQVVAGVVDLERLLDHGLPEEQADTELDVLVGGTGPDELYSGQQGVPNPDTVLGGSYEDAITYVGPQLPPGLLDGGPGNDDLVVPLPAGDTSVDAAARTMAVPGGGVTWTTIERFTFEADDPADRRLTVRGTAGVDDLTVRVQEGLSFAADLGRGNDVLNVLAVPRDGDVDGGGGRDVVLVSTDSGSVQLDLRTGLLESGSGSISGSLSVGGFEAAAVAARRVRLTGTDGPDYLIVEACRAVVRGRGGSDLIDRDGGSDIGRGGGTCRNRSLLDGGAGEDYITSVGRSRDRMLGGPGRDHLVGQRGPDHISGGPGRDTADGGPGPRADTCRAEVEVRCER